MSFNALHRGLFLYMARGAWSVIRNLLARGVSRRAGPQPGQLGDTLTRRATGHLKIVVGLEVDPEAAGRAEDLREPKRGVRGDGAMPPADLMARNEGQGAVLTAWRAA